MQQSKKSSKQIEKELESYSKEGIQVDLTHLKKDMASQFADPYEAFRELVVNAYDAAAPKCEIVIKNEKDYILVTVTDDGHGMDKQGLLDYFQLYRSRKYVPKGKAAGRFGVGKLSIAAIPGLISLDITTTKNGESWHVAAGDLLSSNTIFLYRLDEELPKGSCFEIRFDQSSDVKTVFRKIVAILERYTKYLDIYQLVRADTQEESNEKLLRIIEDDWYKPSEKAKRYPGIAVGRNTYEVVLSFGEQGNEIFQNKIFISNKYNLISHGMSTSIYLPNLKIRVESLDFEMPFGRHCLSNEEILFGLSKEIREKLLPDFYLHMSKYYYDKRKKAYRLTSSTFNDLSLALIKHFPGQEMAWSYVPLFTVFPGDTLSLIDLESEVVKAGNKLYLSSKDSIGIDYSYFDAPVIMGDQGINIINFVTEYFSSSLINLTLDELVIEQPQSKSPNLNDDEKNFCQFLSLHKDVRNYDEVEQAFDRKTILFDSIFDDAARFESSNEHDVILVLKLLDWKLGYLVERDGKTTCKKVIFLLRNKEIILNLYHPQIKKLVKMSRVAPHLAAHWAIALCITDKQKVLPYLDAKLSEKILTIDAIKKIGNIEESTLNMTGNNLGISRDEEKGFEFSNN